MGLAEADPLGRLVKFDLRELESWIKERRVKTLS